jgi:hypothetical protein
MSAENQEELIQAARAAAEPVDWDQIVAYFDSQRALVAPRETNDNPREGGDS